MSKHDTLLHPPLSEQTRDGRLYSDTASRKHERKQCLLCCHLSLQIDWDSRKTTDSSMYNNSPSVKKTLNLHTAVQVKSDKQKIKAPVRATLSMSGVTCKGLKKDGDRETVIHHDRLKL